jgi:myo-inositol-1(or 4)-monophosphatase
MMSPASAASSPDLDADRALLTDAVTDAGETAMRFFGREPAVWYKRPGDPVSEADIAVNDGLKARLLGARPDYGWLSEESLDEGKRLACERVWIVDPIDGTRAFLLDKPEFTISAALVEGDRPIIAAILNPATEELFTASKGGGAWLGGAPISVSARHKLDGAELLTTSNQIDRAREPETFAGATITSLGSIAYRLALVAAGRYDGVISLSGKSDWDLAAADLLMTEAKGHITTITSECYRYNRAEPRHRSVIAANATLHALFLDQFGDNT